MIKCLYSYWRQNVASVTRYFILKAKSYLEMHATKSHLICLFSQANSFQLVVFKVFLNFSFSELNARTSTTLPPHTLLLSAHSQFIHFAFYFTSDKKNGTLTKRYEEKLEEESAFRDENFVHFLKVQTELC